MIPFWLTISDLCYRFLLRVYPADFQVRFAQEMAQVHRTLCRSTYQEAGWAGLIRLWITSLWDWAQAVVFQWSNHLLKARLKPMEHKNRSDQHGVQPLSHLQATLAVLPFLAFGVSSMAAKLDFLQTIPARLSYWQVWFIHPYLVFHWLNLLGLGIGLLSGFPRWTLSYLGWALFFGWWWSDMGFYGQSLDLWIWLPLVVVGLLTLLIKRSLAPLRTLFAGVWQDWTWLSFALYILYSSVFMIFDENHHSQLLLLILLTTILLTVGAWGYYRARSALGSVFSLLGGITGAILISMYSEATWDRRAYYNLPESAQNGNTAGIIGLAVVILLILGTGLLGVWRSRRIKKGI